MSEILKTSDIKCKCGRLAVTEVYIKYRTFTGLRKMCYHCAHKELS